MLSGQKRTNELSMLRAILLSSSLILTTSVLAEGEQLLAAVPQAWIVISTKHYASMRLVELVPPDSSSSNWAEKLGIESFNTLPLPDPIQFMDTMEQSFQRSCTKSESQVTFSGHENNYPTSVRLFNCNKDKLTQMHKIVLVKAIQGTENFYVVSREMRLGAQQKDLSGDVIQQTIARWSSYLATISVCDTNNPQHPCPGK